MFSVRLLAGVLALGTTVATYAHDPTPAARRHVHVHAQAPVVSAAFDPQGRLWRAVVHDGLVLVSSSNDLGKSFGPETAVNGRPQTLWAEGENRPKLAFDTRGGVHVSYTEKLQSEDPMAGHVRHAVSRDGGRRFSEPTIVNDDRRPLSHRFDALVADRNGGAWMVWQDLRDAGPSSRAGAIYFAHASDGEHFGPNVKLAGGTCECCKVGAALGPDGVPVAFWRHVFDGERDHAMARLVPDAQPVRVARDGWKINACPHQGPVIAAGPDGALHFAWFTGAEGKQGIAYARSVDGGRSTEAPARFLAGAQTYSRPAVLASGSQAWIAWKAFDGTTTRVMLARSDDGGRHWQAPVALASTARVNDHPQLLEHAGRAFLAWSVEGEPWRLLALGESK